MPLIYGAVVPHSPVFLPTFNEEARSKVSQTIQALTLIRNRIEELKPDTILVIAPHDENIQKGESYTFHVPTSYRANFTEFGDIITNTEYFADTVLANQIKEKLTQAGVPVTYASEETLDYNAGVPLECIAKGFQAKVLILHPPAKNLEALFSDGSQILKILQESQKRIVCIASGDLSHCLTDTAPLPFNEQGVELDMNIVKWIKSKRTKSFFAIPPELPNEVGACGIPSLVLLLGIVKHVKHEVRVVSYEGTVGVGHLVSEYIIS